MNTLIKEQLVAVNNMILPLDVINIIKSYAYYDTNSVEYAKKLAEKNPTLEKIKKAISRNNNKDYFENSDKNELWLFGFDEDTHEKIQLQCVNCSKCGNYKDVSEDTILKYIIRKKIPILCLCSDNEYLQEYEYYNDENNDDGYDTDITDNGGLDGMEFY
jgi:hypothetical protein